MSELLPILTLESIRSRTLFYPCAGEDWLYVFTLLNRWIDRFWFVDIRYNSNSVNSYPHHGDIESPSVTDFRGITLSRKLPIDIRVHRYSISCDNQQKEVNFCRGRGYDTFRACIQEPGIRLSVFFYRGDSEGESGSDFYWLSRPNLEPLVEQMDNPAVLITDGSNCRIHTDLRKFHRQKEVTGEAALPQLLPFRFGDRDFTPVGWVSERYGPTIIWELK